MGPPNKFKNVATLMNVITKFDLLEINDEFP